MEIFPDFPISRYSSVNMFRSSRLLNHSPLVFEKSTWRLVTTLHCAFLIYLCFNQFVCHHRGLSTFPILQFAARVKTFSKAGETSRRLSTLMTEWSQLESIEWFYVHMFWSLISLEHSTSMVMDSRYPEKGKSDILYQVDYYTGIILDCPWLFIIVYYLFIMVESD